MLFLASFCDFWCVHNNKILNKEIENHYTLRDCYYLYSVTIYNVRKIGYFVRITCKLSLDFCIPLIYTFGMQKVVVNCRAKKKWAVQQTTRNQHK